MYVLFMFTDKRDLSSYTYRVSIEYDVHNYWENVYPEKSQLTAFQVNSIETF